jgi:hypothetical protein
MGEPQRLTDTEQLQMVAMIEAANSDLLPCGPPVPGAELMRRLYVLGERIAGELVDQDRDLKSVRR